MFYGWLIDWLTDSTVQGLTKWLNDLIGWLIDWITDSTVQGLTNWLNDLWLKLMIDSLTDSTVQELTIWLNDLWLIDWLTDWLTNTLKQWFTNVTVKGKTNTNGKPLEWEKRTDNEWLVNSLQSFEMVWLTVRTDE